MKTSICLITGALAALSLMPSRSAYAASGEAQNILINEQLQVPGALLAPGKYTLSVENHLYDRAIVQITQIGKSESYLVLAVPNAGIKEESGLIFFRQHLDTTAALKGWHGLELVYPKAEAVKITGDSGQTVLAIDPAGDKLPAKLSAEDMKVVTLWSLSPKTLTSDQRGMGVAAVKYASASDSSATFEPGVKPAAPVQTADASVQHAVKKLPKTASNNYLYLLCGALLISLSAGFRTLRLDRVTAR